jgi:orotate phosphoribosyltransferase
VSGQLVPDEILDLLVPSKDGAEHLTTEIIVGETSVHGSHVVLVGDVTQTSASVLEQIMNLAVIRAAGNLIAKARGPSSRTAGRH